jgi:hypothetical protein
MPKTPKEDDKETETSEKTAEKDAWADDQKKHSYYYDDAHGYEKYVDSPDDDDEKNDE